MTSNGSNGSGALTQEAILEALKDVKDPELHRPLVALGMIQDVTVEGGSVGLRVVLTTPACPFREQVQQEVRDAVMLLPGVDSVDIEMGANVRASSNEGKAKPIEGVRNVIAVASNKGGVGKSTVAVNLSVALAQLGARVGLMDADITGPNIPTMTGVAAGIQSQEGMHVVERYGVKVASIGFVLQKGMPVVWRGPMIGSAVRQLMHDVAWGELDYLVIDLPPGTSDASMSMAQDAAISGAVVVSTPQEVSIEDATKAVGMFERLNVPVFGIVENMSYFACPHCGERTEIFGHGGARAAAEELGLDFLGEVPLHPAIRQGSDIGAPIVATDPESPQARALIEIAERVAARLSVLQFVGSVA
ncbi:MAG: P-loop NTPase [Dehalococcoidia bacterium]|nr:P-loop NTPase [Dehalococcoidia bacterium]